MNNVELLKVVANVAEVGKVIEMISQSDSLVGKGMAVLSLSDEIMNLLSIDLGELKAEFEALDEKDIDALKADFDAKFDLENDAMEDIIEMGFDVLIELGDAISLAIDICWTKISALIAFIKALYNVFKKDKGQDKCDTPEK